MLQRTHWLLAVVLGALACAAHAAAEPPAPHVHGAAELRVVVDGPKLELALESPLDNVLGFEHAPRNEQQRAAVRAMAGKLRKAEALFVPSVAARCALASVQLASSALPADLLGEAKAGGHPEAEAGDGHADLDASFVFNCAVPNRLDGMEVRLQQQFPGLRKLTVEIVGPRGQSATVLTPGKRSVSW